MAKAKARGDKKALQRLQAQQDKSGDRSVALPFSQLARFELFSELAEGAEGTALEVRQGVRR
jgi:hypothetical protein